jgi:hypothetical protein
MLLKPTAHPSFLLIGLFGGPKETEVRLYAVGVGPTVRSGNLGTGTMFQVEPS